MNTVKGIAAAAAAVITVLAAAPAAPPQYCYTTGKFLPWPYTGYCPDGQLGGPGPTYGGGGAHRWPDGSDD